MELIVLICLVVGGLIAFGINDAKKLDAMSPEERRKTLKARKESSDQFKWGNKNPHIICPHCQQLGNVRTSSISRKKGISGGKVTAAVLTGGVTMLATGLSRKEKTTQAHCTNCNCTWDF